MALYTSSSSYQREDVLSFLAGLDFPALNREHGEMLDSAITAEKIKLSVSCVLVNHVGPMD